MQDVFHINGNKHFIIPFIKELKELHEYIEVTFYEMNINPQNFLEFMEENDNYHWINYFHYIYLCPSDSDGHRKKSYQCDADLYISIVMGFIFDFNRKKSLCLADIVKNEIFRYTINDYKLTKVSNVEFHSDYFLFDNKAYLYSLYTITEPISFGDCMPGFARIITDEVADGDILLRLDEKLALPKVKCSPCQGQF